MIQICEIVDEKFAKSRDDVTFLVKLLVPTIVLKLRIFVNLSHHDGFDAKIVEWLRGNYKNSRNMTKS